MSEFKSWEELTPLEQAASTHWDFYKEVYGVRPRHIDVSAWTMVDFETEFASLSREAELNFVQEKADQDDAVEAFESTVQLTIDSGAGDRDTALRWIMDASKAEGDWDYFCYLHNLPYHYFNKTA